MTNETNPKRPLYRVCFSPIDGKDRNGQDQLGYAREIGAVWPRKDGKGAILKLDIVPVELTHRQGVTFLFPGDEVAKGPNSV